jgi:hypothetical protein
LRHAGLAALALAAAVLAGCAAPETRPRGEAAAARALVESKLPPGLADRAGWAADIYASLAALGIEPTEGNACAVVAVIAQESGFKVDPAVANLAASAWKEIEQQRARIGIPRLALDVALDLRSSDSRTYRARIDAATTERELSDLFEEFIDRVPLGRRFLEDRNPVRTGGPMQVAIAYAREHAQRREYPYAMKGSVRDEVFTRRGGLYFGIAHLLDYPAPYDRYTYRFADFNAGHYASRNAAFQKAVAALSGKALALDGDLLRYEDGRAAQAPGETELAARSIADRIGMSPVEIRRDLERGLEAGFDGTRLFVRVFQLADRAAGKPVARAAIPQIALQSSKFTRKLTTEWFATRVAARHRECMARDWNVSGNPSSGPPARGTR